MRIIHVIASLGVGGAERTLTDLLPYVRRQGNEVSVAVMRLPLDLKSELEDSGVYVTLLPKRHKWNVLASALDIARLARKSDTEVIHAHLYFSAVSISIMKILHLCDAVTIATFHNLAYEEGVNRKGLGLRLKKFLASLLYPHGLDCKLAVSKAVADHYQSSLGLNTIHVIHNSVDIGHIRSMCLHKERDNFSQLHIVLPGRLVHEKGHSDLIQSLCILRDRGLLFRVTFAGGGPKKSAIEREILECGLVESVQLTGVLEHDKLLETVASADIVVVPSRFEGFGLTVIEAMALSKPVIVTDVGGLPEIVESNLNGVIVPPAEPLPLADALGKLMTDSGIRLRLGKAGLARVEQEFSLPLVGEKLIKRYESLLSNHK